MMQHLVIQRLYNQQLAQPRFDSAGEVVAWMGAVQAQEYAPAKWALALRMQNASDAAIEQAFSEGSILRTHIIRPTWHFVAPADIRWLLQLTAPRVHAVNAYMYRKLELDNALLTRSSEVIVKALDGGRHLTRAELGTALAQAGILADKMRLGYIVHYAELESLVCSGPRRGKQFTYALLDERAPQAGTLAHDEALAELTRRYFTSHGPATVHDFAWWSGLTKADARRGVDLANSELTYERINNQLYWFSDSTPPLSGTPSTAYLLPTYDEFLVGYAMFDNSRTGGKDMGHNLVFDSTILMDGHIIGSWRRTFHKGAVVIQLAPFGPLTPVQHEAVSAAIQRYGEFLGLPVVLA